MSTGNLTFHYPTKEHLLAELADMLCGFHWKQMEKEAGEGISSVLAVCLELTAMAGACEDDEIIKDFFLCSYASPLCLAVIRKNETDFYENAQHVYTDENYACEICGKLFSDVNGDGTLNISDVNNLIIHLAGMNENEDWTVDIDRNGVVNIDDLNTLLIILSTTS